MHRVVIVSDSHRLQNELVEIVQRHQADVFLHCGDSELTTDATYLQHYVTVRGNCDWDHAFPLEKTLEVGGLRFFVTHGHLYNVKSGLLQLHYRALELDADIACYGHSHVANVEQMKKLLLINPGSIRTPRYFTLPSYCVLEWEDRASINVTYYHIDGTLLEHFPAKTNICL